MLRATASVSTLAVAGQAVGVTAAQSSGADFGGWFDNTSNYDGVTDKTGTEQVTISVGSKANGGNFGFSPAAVRVDPGTKIIWNWTGEGGQHNVVAQDGSFSSELATSEGHTFTRTFEDTARIPYYCEPHESLGMKGAVVVGDPPVGGANGSNASGGAGGASGGSSTDGETTSGGAGGASGGSSTDAATTSGATGGGSGGSGLSSVPPALLAVGGGLLLAVLSPLLFAVFIAIRGTGDGGSSTDTASATDDEATSAGGSTVGNASGGDATVGNASGGDATGGDSAGWVAGANKRDWHFSRRAMMAGAAGTAGGVAAGGAIGTAIADAELASTENGDDASIHPVYGFTGKSSDVEPPVEPDHEVQLLFGSPREERPEWASESVAEVYFEPTGLYVEPGDTVKFNAATPHHNVMSYHEAYAFSPRVPEGAPPLASPILATGAYWLYTFDTEGVYDLNCSPHQFMGMAMRIVVGSATGPGAEPLPEPGTEAATVSDLEEGGKEPRLPSGTAYTVLRDSALDPERIIDQGAVKWGVLDDESKQLWPTVVGPPTKPGSSTSNSN